MTPEERDTAAARHWHLVSCDTPECQLPHRRDSLRVIDDTPLAQREAAEAALAEVEPVLEAARKWMAAEPEDGWKPEYDLRRAIYAYEAATSSSRKP